MSGNAFVALDVETANADSSSICQIGVVTFENSVVADTWVSFVNPEDEFDEFNVSIHGISEDDVIDAPTFLSIATHLDQLIADRIVVCHTGFDRAALSRAYAKHGLSIPECCWLDSARVLLRALSQFERKGYGLANLAEWCGISFSHHDACEDARATGLVLIKAIDDTGTACHSRHATRSRRPPRKDRPDYAVGLLPDCERQRPRQGLPGVSRFCERAETTSAAGSLHPTIRLSD